MRSLSVLTWVCLCLGVCRIPRCLSSPTGTPENQHNSKHDEKDTNERIWDLSMEAEPLQESLRLSTLVGNEKEKDNADEDIPAETMDVAESRSIFTTLLSPFMNGRLRPGSRAPQRGREKIIQGRRPPFPNQYFSPPQPQRFSPSGQRKRLPNPTHQTHVFTPIHSSPFNNVHFPRFPQFPPGQIVVDVNSLPPAQIKYEEGSIPKPGDSFHVPIGNVDNDENTDFNNDDVKSHFSIIPSQPQISPPLVNHESLPDPPHVPQENIFNQQPPSIRESPISTSVNNKDQDPSLYSHGSNTKQNDPFANSILPTNDENLQGFFSQNSVNNIRAVADQFLTPFHPRPDSQEPYGFNNDDFFITGNFSEFTGNTFESHHEKESKEAQTPAPFFATFSTTTLIPFTLQTQAHPAPTQRKPFTQVPQLQHTQPSFPENLRTKPPSKPSSDFDTVYPLKATSHVSEDKSSPAHPELQRTTPSFRHEFPKTPSPQANLRTQPTIQQTRATTANHLAKNQQSWTLQNQHQWTTPQNHQTQTTPKHQQSLLGSKNQQPRTTPPPQPNQQPRTIPPNQHPRPTPNHNQRSPVPNQQPITNPAHQQTRTTSLNLQGTTAQPSFQPNKPPIPQSQFKITHSPTHSSQITQAFQNWPKPTQISQIRPSVTPGSHHNSQTTFAPKFTPDTTTQDYKSQSTVSLPQTTHTRFQTQVPNTQTRPSATLTVPQLKGERSENTQNQQQRIESDFDPLPGFTNDELGSFGFVPFGNSDDFFSHVFGGENPFGSKITTKGPVAGSSSSPPQLVQTGKSLLQDEHTRFVSGFSPRPFQQEDPSHFSFQSLSPVTRPPRQTPPDINLGTVQPIHQTTTSVHSFSSQSPPSTTTFHSSSSVFSSTQSSHQQNINGDFFTTLVPVTSSSSDIFSQPFSTTSSGLSSGDFTFQRTVSYPQSINDLPAATSKPSQPEVHWGTQEFREEQFAEHQLQENDNSPAFSTDLPERTIVPFTLSEAGQNPYTTSQPFQGFQNSGQEFIISHGGAEARLENTLPPAISATTKIDDKEFEVLVLPYESQERNQEAIFSNFDSTRDHISGINGNKHLTQENFKAGLLPGQPGGEEEVSVFLVRHRRPSTIAGGSPTPPTSFSPQLGDDLNLTDSFGGLGQDALEFPGFPVPLEFQVKDDGLPIETSTSWAKDPLPSESRLLASGRKLSFDFEDLGSPEVTTLPEEFQGTFDPEDFDPSSDFEGTKSEHSLIDFTGPQTIVNKYEEPDEYVKVLGLLAPPPGVVCDHGFCETEETRRKK